MILKNIYQILKYSDVNIKSYFYLFFLFIVSFILESLGLGAIIYIFNLLATGNQSLPLGLDQYLSFNLWNLNKDKSIFLNVIIILIFIFFLRSIFLIINYYLIVLTSWKITSKIRLKILQNYQLSNLSNFYQRKKSQYLYNFQKLTEEFYGIVISLLRSAIEFLFLLSFLFVLILTDIVFFITLGLSFLILAIINDKLTKNYLHKLGKSINDSGTELLNIFNSSIDGFKEIKMFNKEKLFSIKLKKSSKIYSKKTALTKTFAIMPSYLIEFLFLFLVSLYLIFLTNSNNDLGLALSNVGIYAIIFLRAKPILNNLFSNITTLRYSKDLVRRLLNELGNAESNKIVISTYKEDYFQSLLLKHVSFSYGNKNILNDINFEIKKGDIIGIQGRSGEGKTTLINIISNLLLPTNGELILNSKHSMKLNMHYKNLFSIIPQDTFILNGSIELNITLEDKSVADIDRLNNAINYSMLNELISNLPNGINEIIGENASLISGGQKQRIAIARALYHDCKILILDEATSSLDKDTESKVLNNICNLQKEITIIIVSHNQSSFQYCNKVLTLNNGQLHFKK